MSHRAPITGITGQDRSAPRILIVRLSSLGDVVHGLPVLNALRQGLPQSCLAWLVEKPFVPLLDGHPALDRLFVVPKGWLASPRAVWQLRSQLRAFKFDVAIDVQGLTKSALAARLSGAPRRIGFGDEKGRELSRLFYTTYVKTAARHVIDCNLSLLRPLGIESPEVRYELPRHPRDEAAAEAILDAAGLTGPFGVLNPGAGSPSRLWPPSRFAAVARHLAQACDLPTLVVWAGEKERRWAAQIAAESEGGAKLAPSTTILQLAALARRARLFISSCTGPLHIAEATGTPCVGLYGPWPAERNGPYGKQHIALQVVQFEGNTRQRRNAPKELMEAISVESVCQACRTILERKTTSRRSDPASTSPPKAHVAAGQDRGGPGAPGPARLPGAGIVAGG